MTSNHVTSTRSAAPLVGLLLAAAGVVLLMGTTLVTDDATMWAVRAAIATAGLCTVTGWLGMRKAARELLYAALGIGLAAAALAAIA